MNLGQIKKAHKIYTEIQKLDEEIININKAALLVAEDVQKIDLSISVKTIPKPEDEKVKFDADGSLISDTYKITFDYSSLLGFRTSKEEKKDDDKMKFKQEISNNSALQILGILLYEKNQLREQLIEKLNKIK